MAISGTKDTTCFVCGPDNPLGLRVPFAPDGDAGSTAVYVARKEHGGWNGILHGGVTFSLMDEAFGWCLYFQDIPSVTARIETRFHRPIPIGTRLHIRAWVVGQRKRLFDAKAEVREGDAGGTLLAESEAVLCRVAPDAMPELELVGASR
ncbi:PaaI family thioesterase [Granulicella mallensis]|uniref:Acyl-coenzyme A thioesterase THEM4 n=1 Tax=Granulicella mallensis TaxID=940614 RepID=A0A7W7ZTE3_9BACT|nr:PaaI family thioesterase [Granulicella mallensis]MBB5065442.1 acyl-coenzyme A thioesterase PaaI-like protein [Granulicella mallensis]